MRVTFYEEDSTRKGGPLGRVWHLLLGAAFGGETHYPWVYPVCGTYISIDVCIGLELNKRKKCGVDQCHTTQRHCVFIMRTKLVAKYQSRVRAKTP